MAARRTLLSAAFGLLYGPLVLLHEPAGRLAYGPSWSGRRFRLLEGIDATDRVLDVGAGEGLLVLAAAAIGLDVVGVDPSPAMRRLAARRGAPVVPGRAQSIPFPDASFTWLVSSYPGPWLADAAAWSEFARVLAPGGRLAILLGGTVERGTGSRARGMAARVVYGRGRADLSSGLELPKQDAILGGSEISEDEWGHTLIWRGQRA